MNDVNDLLDKAERGNRLTHIGQNLLAILIIAVLGLLTIATIETNQQLRQQLQASQKQNQQQTADTQHVISEVQRQSAQQTAYIRCIALFFATPDRVGRTIDSLDSCQIDGIPRVVPTPPGAPGGVSTQDSDQSSSKNLETPVATQEAPQATATPTPMPTAPVEPNQGNIINRAIDAIVGAIRGL